MIHILKPEHWTSYAIIDSGHGYKLEQFGELILSRPEPQALWNRNLTEDDWQKKAHAVFTRDKANPEKGTWILKNNIPERWKINYQYKEMKLVFRLGMTAFKHIGIFPEQAVNWDYIFDKITALKKQIPAPKVLNLFAYTGGASLAAKSAGADITHVDSVKQVISWGNENMQYSHLEDIRWIVEDALKFVKREYKRGNLYHGIVLDPPAYGRGPDGERWILEDLIQELIFHCSKILSPKNHFFILNLYSMGFSPIIAETLVRSNFGEVENPCSAELVVEDTFGKKLPLGIFYRFSDIL